MLTVTEGAKQLLSEHSDDPETSIRLLNDGGELGLVLGSESEGDQVVEYEGAKILLVSPGLATSLEGSKLDVKVLDEGRELFLTK